MVVPPADPFVPRRNRKPILLLSAMVFLTGELAGLAQIQRVLGLDISAWQGNISQTTWNNLRNVENRQFVILRSSRGGTTGYYNQNDANNNQGLNTLSQRYDDPYYVQNINRATTAGMFAGSYHFSRPDIVAGTLNSGGIPNSGTDEADHFIQMAGPWMRPGYLMPVHDFEAGKDIRTDNELAQFCVDFSNRIYERMGIRPAMYTGGDYSANVLQTASLSLRNQLAQPAAYQPSITEPCYPTLWNARYPNQADPNSIDVQNGNPKDSYSGFYGPWDDYGVSQPWVFWQYASTVRLPSFNNGNNNLDADVAHGGLEFLKDQLIPAVWTHDGNGDWSTLTNWNSGRAPVAPVPGPGQVAPVGTQTLPTPRLPGAAGSGVTSGQHDTVILERPNANITVSLTTGNHNIRKLYQRETLNLSGGNLTINYTPSADSTPISAQFSGAVTLSGSGALSVHTLQVDAMQTFTLAGGTLTLNTLLLMPHASTPAKLLVTGDVNLNALANVTAVIGKGTGSGSSGFVDLGAASRILSINNGAAEVDLSVNVPIFNGSLTKAGAGTMRLTSANYYAGGTTISAGRLLVSNTTGSGVGPGSVNVDGGILGGTGVIAGSVNLNGGGTLAPGTESTLGGLMINSPPVLSGAIFMRVNRNGGAPLADQLTLTSGSLTYGGMLIVSNAGPALLGGEAFTIFVAPAYAGGFPSSNLPPLSDGLNWYTGGLVTNGVIKVNRSPVPGALSFTNTAPSVLQIPLASLINQATDADADALTVSRVSPSTTNGIALFTDGTSISYSNRLSLTDQFTYELDDGHGGRATGVVSIVNIGSSPAAQFSHSPISHGSAVELHFTAVPGWKYYLERSTNLLDWVTIWSEVAPPGGEVVFADDFVEVGGPPAVALYRLRWDP